jgi:hypothetical protein
MMRVSERDNAPQNPRQAEVDQALREAQQAVRDAALQAREAAQAARVAAQDAAAQGAAAGDIPQPPAPPAPPGTIIIPGDGGGDPVQIRVDGQGIHVAQNGTETVIPIHDVVPRGAVQIAYALSAALVAVAILGPLLRFFLRRAERRSVTTQLSAEVQARLDAMDRNIDTVAVELERVSEGQRFTNKLLEQRPLEHAQRSDR